MSPQVFIHLCPKNSEDVQVVILRDKGFQDSKRGILRNKVTLSRGYSELSGLLNINAKTISSWLPPIEECVNKVTGREGEKKSWIYQSEKRKVIGRFINSKTAKIDFSGNKSTRYLFDINLQEPLIDEQLVLISIIKLVVWNEVLSDESLIREKLLKIINWAIHEITENVEINHLDSEKLTGLESEQPFFEQVWKVHNPTDLLSGIRAGCDSLGLEYAQVLVWKPRDIKVIFKKFFSFKILNKIKQYLLQPGYCEPNDEISFSKNYSAVVWSISLVDKILMTAGVGSQSRDQLQDTLGEDAEKLKYFVAWLLFAYEKRATKHQKGIDAPEIFTLSRYANSKPGRVYIELAGRTPNVLVNLLKTQFLTNEGLKEGERAVIQKVGENGFADILEDAIQQVRF